MLATLFTFAEIGTAEFILSTVVSIVLGLIIAFLHMYRNPSYSKNFIVSLVILPVIIQVVIMMVNGNIGTGVAVMGAFTLVRFRSVPGNSREIVSVLTAMGVGLATGMSYLSLAIVLTVVVEALVFIMSSLHIHEGKEFERDLRITIPEDLDYSGVFDDIFAGYTKTAKLEKVKTVNMGSLYELQYHISLKDDSLEKQMIDDIRTRNGNLSVVCGRVPERREEL